MTGGARGDQATSQKADAVRETGRIAAELARLDGKTTDPFAAAVRATRMPMVVTDPRQPDNPIVFANDSFCRLTGYRRDEIVGRNCRFLQGPDSDPAVIARIREAIAKIQPLEIDVRNHRKNGEPFWNRLLMAPVHDANGELAYFFASQVDVTLERERLAGLESHNAALMAEVAGRLSAQRESEVRLRFATEAGKMGVWDLDLQTGQFTTSALCREIFGRDRDAPFTMEDLIQTVHPDDRASREGALAGAVATGKDCDLEYRVIRPDGQVAWLQVRAQVMRAQDGTPLRLAGISMDITERRQVEQELRQTNALLSTILQTASGLIYAKDREGRVLIANQPTLELIGKPWSEVKGRTDREFLSDRAQAEIVMANDLRVMTEGATQVLEEHVGTDLGRTRVWLSTKTPLRDLAGEIVGLVGVSQDITGRFRVERELQDLNASLELRVAERTRERDRTWNNSQDLLLVLGPGGLIQSVNPAWHVVLGWASEDLLGRRIVEFIHADDLEDAKAAFAAARQSNTLPRLENRIWHKDGSWRWIAWVATPEGSQIYASGRHVTAERESAAALARTEDALRQAQKMEAVGQLTGGIAHDFNNLLTGITGSLELVQRRVASGKLNGLDRYTSAAITSAQRAAALTQRLLAFARRQPLDPRRVEANRLVAGMEDLLRRTLGPASELELGLAAGLWSTLCDPNQLESAMLNLAINARDAMPKGGRLTIRTANVVVDETFAQGSAGDIAAGQFVAVSVSDTGIGMTPDTIARAFEPFFTTKPTGQGTGLGLSMLYGFVRQSGGHVRIDSEIGCGTRFTIYLPRYRGDQAGADGDPLPDEAGPLAREADGEAVLVVDDEPTVRMLVVETLQELGYAAVEAGDGLAALRILEAGGRIDLLVTDVGMPGMNGRQLAEAARVLRPNLPVLFMTGYAHNAAIGDGAALAPGMEIVTKPFVLEVLSSKIRHMLLASPRG